MQRPWVQSLVRELKPARCNKGLKPPNKQIKENRFHTGYFNRMWDRTVIKQGLEDSKNKRRTLRSNQDIRYPKKQLPPEALGEWWKDAKGEASRDGGAWWAAVYGVAQSRTGLKRLSSSSSSKKHLSEINIFESTKLKNETGTSSTDA